MIISPKSNSLTSQLNVNCSARSIKIATKVKYLGIIINNKLKFKDQINFVETKIFRSVGILGKLKNYLDITSLLKLYYALIHSHINYLGRLTIMTYLSYLTRLTILKISQLGL